MRLLVKSSSISYSFNPNNNSDSITFEVIPEGRQKITIADKYVFGSQFPETDKVGISGRLSIKKIEPRYIEHHNLNSERIGFINFFEEMVDEFGQWSSPAQIYFTVFIPAEQYDEIKQATLMKFSVSHLSLFSNDLDFGWEPDGSHQIWKRNESEDFSKKLKLEPAYISNFDIGFGDIFTDEYFEGRDNLNSQNGKSIHTNIDSKPSSLKIFLDEYKYLIIVIVIGLFLFYK